MRLRHWLFDRGDNLAGGIYGTILVTSIVAGSSFVDILARRAQPKQRRPRSR